MFWNTPTKWGVERKHRHLLETVRALRFQAGLPLFFGRMCVFTAARLINRLPTLRLGFESPHEILLKSPPDYKHLRIFGCWCYTHNINFNHKFDPGARNCIFIGYPEGQRGYKCYGLETNKILLVEIYVFMRLKVLSDRKMTLNIHSYSLTR